MQRSSPRRTAIENHVTTAGPRDRGVLIPGASAPKLVSAAPGQADEAGLRHRRRRDRPRAAAFETSRPTTHAEPVYVVDGVTHYCVATCRGGVPRTSTFALNNATLPFVAGARQQGLEEGARRRRPLKSASNIAFGKVTCQPVAEAAPLRVRAAERVM